jgi:hypothetical protein
VIDTRSTGFGGIVFAQGGSGYITMIANSIASNSNAVKGVSTVGFLVSIGNYNPGVGSLMLDGKATHQVQLDPAEFALLGVAFKTSLSFAPPSSGSTVFIDLANGQKDSGGVVPAYGVGRGDLSLVATTDYRTAVNARHRFLVDGTETFKVDSHGPRAVGQAVGLASLNTAQRNALGAANVGAGGAVWDSSLGKPVFSDGTNWRDSAANIV